MAPLARTGGGNVTSANGSSVSTLAVAKPTNLADHDLLIAIVYHRNSGATLTAPTGWSWAKQDSGNATYGIAYKQITDASSEASSYSFSTSSGPARMIAGIARVTGADLDAPIDATGATSANTGTSSLTMPAVTAVTTTCLLLALETNNAGATVASFTQDAAMSGVTQLAVTASGSTCNIQLAQQQLTAAGSTGTRTATMSPAANNSAGFMVTIKAATETHTGTGTLTGAASLTASGAKAASGTAAAAPAATLTASGTKAVTGTGTPIAATATLTSSGFPPWATWKVAVDWGNDGDFTSTGDDVTGRTLERGGLSMQYGRDEDRELSPMAAGSADLELDNTSRDYSPDNAGSPLYGNVLPARPVRVTVTDLGVEYKLFTGFTDEYTVNPAPADRSVSVTALDAVAKLKGAKATTELYQGIRTGDAIGYVLDAVGWPDDMRDLDAGATTPQWWWVQDEDAFEAIQKLVQSEGPPAMLTSDELGRIVFRDRHHRLLDAASKSVQETFTDESTGEPSFSDLSYEHGWADIVNSVTAKVDERAPAALPETVWSSPSNVQVDMNATVTFHLSFDDPIVNPVVTYTVLSGTVTKTVSVDSGQTLTVALAAGSGGAEIQGLKVTAQPVRVTRSFTIQLQDDDSIAEYGLRDLDYELPWAGYNDAGAVAQLVLDASAQRRPTVTLTLRSSTQEASTRLTQQLARDLSDRVHIREPETCVDHDFHIEQITHKVSAAGLVLETELAMERAMFQPADVFLFGVDGHGFDDGVFASVSLADPETLLIFDVDGHGFDDGVFAS